MTTWPVNYAGQALTAQAIQKRIDDLKRVQTKITVLSWHVPTQAEFEAAYVSQTGFSLPIPSGTFLLWYDMRQGNMKPFTVVNDLANGTQSSGIPRPYVAPQTTSPFRFIGSAAGPALIPMNTHMKWSANSARFLITPTEWQRYGLSMLWIYFSIRIDSTNFFVFPDSIDPSQVWTDLAVEVAGDNVQDLIRLEVQASVETLANNQDTSLGQEQLASSVASFSSSHADSYMNGVLYVWDVSDTIDEADNLLPADRGSAGMGYVSSISTGITTGQLNVSFFGFEKTNNVPSAGGVGLPGLLADNHADKDSRIWFYGLFNKPPPAVLEEYS